MLFSLSMFPPMFVSALFLDEALKDFSLTFVVTFLLGLAVWMPTQGRYQELRMRDGFLVVVLFWSVLSFCGALPFLFSPHHHLSFTDSIFEAFSGLTTTGATVVQDIEALPISLRFYRQQLQWMGGMGIIVLAVAVLPMLGVGGMQLYRAETPGPIKDAKLTPRITETAKALWYIYLGLTICCALAYWLAGMSVMDAIGHSFSTISIGGFSLYNDSLAHFNNPLIEVIAIVFMLIAGVNFSLHFFSFQRLSLKVYREDSEFRFYILFLLLVTVLVSLVLIWQQTFPGFWDNIRYGVFQAVSIGTTTGFTTTSFASWPLMLPTLLLFVSFVGGCAGSTGGGLKAIRVLLLFKQGSRELKRLIHPSGLFSIKLGNKAIPDGVVESVWGFFSAYLFLFVLLMLLLMMTGLDQVTAFSAIAACMNNMGPGLGDVSQHYGNINDVGKWILCAAMLLGRLEIFTLLVLFRPMFWRS